MADKNLIKIATIIAYIWGVICCITIVGLVVGIPLIIGARKFDEIYQSESLTQGNIDSILIWSIVFLCLCQISGILGFIYYFGVSTPNNYSNSKGTSNSSKYEDLEKLKKLYDNKTITKEEYEKEKERIFSGN